VAFELLQLTMTKILVCKLALAVAGETTTWLPGEGRYSLKHCQT